MGATRVNTEGKRIVDGRRCCSMKEMGFGMSLGTAESCESQRKMRTKALKIHE